MQIVVAHERREFKDVSVLTPVLATLRAEGIAQHHARRPRFVETPAHFGIKLQSGGLGLRVVPISDGTACKQSSLVVVLMKRRNGLFLCPPEKGMIDKIRVNIVLFIVENNEIYWKSELCLLREIKKRIISLRQVRFL